MPKGVSIHWSKEHEAIIADWIKKYPKGKTINLKQIEYAEPEKWKELIAAGHKPGSMRDKARYLLGQKLISKPDRNVKGSRSEKLDDGRYRCKLCDEIVHNKQALGTHYRFNCSGQKPKALPKSLPPAASSTDWHFCPNCAYPLAH